MEINSKYWNGDKTISLQVVKAITKWKIVIWHIWSKSKGWQHVDERNVLFGLEFITWMNLNMDASQLCESKWPFWGSWRHGWWRVSHENSTTWINVLMDKIDHVVGHMDEFYSSMKMNMYGWITSFEKDLSMLSIHIDIIYP